MRIGEDDDDMDGLGADPSDIIEQIKTFDVKQLPDYLKKAEALLSRTKRVKSSTPPPPPPAPVYQPAPQAPLTTEGIGVWPVVAILAGVGVLGFALLSKKGGPLAGLADALDLPTGR